MPELKIEHPHVVWYKDLENFILEIYGKKIDIQGGFYANDTVIKEEALDITEEDSGSEWYSDYKANMAIFKAHGMPEISLEYVLADLATQDLIPVGRYLIHIWW